MIAGPDLRLLSPGFSRAIDVSFPLLEVGRKFLFSCFPRAGFFSSARIVEVMEWPTGRHRLEEGKMEEKVHINTEQLPLLLFTL